MDIDLLFTKDGQAGLISSENFIKKVAGAVLDTKSGLLTLEFVDSDYLELNIPVDPAFFERLDQTPHVQIGAVKNSNIAQAYQIPLMFNDDPYRGDALMNSMAARAPLGSFSAFVTRCIAGQPVHRDDLGNEDSMGCILGDASPSSLQFAPHLARRAAMEAGPKTPAPAPRMGGPGLGGSSGGGGGYTNYRSPPKKPDEDDRS